MAEEGMRLDRPPPAAAGAGDADGVMTGEAGDHAEEAVRSRSSKPIISTREEISAMSHRSTFHAAVVACMCCAALMARLAAAEPTSLRIDPALMSAQTPASSAPSEPTTTGGPASAEELAKKLSNPIASLISVPFQSNFDFNTGLAGGIHENTRNSPVDIAHS
jgi:hypothetical protein